MIPDIQKLTHQANGHVENLFSHLREIADHLATVADAVTEKVAESEYGWESFKGTVGAAATTVALECRTKPGSARLVKIITVTGTAGGTVGVYLDAVQPQFLINVLTIPASGMLSQNQEIYVPAGRLLIFNFTVQSNNQFVTAGVQSKFLTRIPEKTVRHSDTGDFT